MTYLSPETEALARQLAAARGISLDEAVKAALEETTTETMSRCDTRAKLSRDDLIQKMEEIAARCSARPLIDPRSPDELIGYDDYGLPG